MIISVTPPVTVTVLDTDGTPQAELRVYTFDGETYSNHSATTDENGQVIMSLPQGEYRFRADLYGTQFWSGTENTCALPTCITDSVTVTKPVTVTVAGEAGNPYAELNVYAFDGETYAGYSAKTDAAGQVIFTLPVGNYHFRADYDGVQFWSGNENTCTLPGCEEDAVTLPGGTGNVHVSIDYTYDALNRLISAEYSNGTAFGYTYDAAGNVLTYAASHYGKSTVTTYTYDAANQLLSATEGETVWNYIYDGNGSLIQSNPGTGAANGSTRYTYNTAGYLTKVENFTTEWQTQSEMKYDGLGNRLETTTYSGEEPTTTHYVLDSGSTLTSMTGETSTFYLYGMGVIGTLGESWSYILPDGAGSTRQLVNEEGAVQLSVSYTPWGDTLEIYGSGMLNLGYLGGVYDAGTGLIYMGNGQYYDPSTGRFLTRGAKPEQSNPYTPWNRDPAGMLVAPLALLVMVFGYKKNKTKFDQFIILLVIAVSLGLSVSACSGGGTPTTQPSETPSPTLTPTPTDTPSPTTVPSVTPQPTNTVTLTPTLDICIKINFLPAPDIENYDPTVEPNFITSWNPSVTVPLSPSIEENTKDSQLHPFNAEKYMGGNLCGLIALSMIAEKYGYGDLLVDMWTSLGGPTGRLDWLDLQKAVINTFPESWAVKGYAWTESLYVDTDGGRDYDNSRSWSGSEYGIYGDIAAQELFRMMSISPPHYLLLMSNLEVINGFGTLVPRAKTGHWVLLTGLSQSCGNSGWQSDEYSSWNWVRINNPYNNRVEYYPWKDFKESISISTGDAVWQLLELWKN